MKKGHAEGIYAERIECAGSLRLKEVDMSGKSAWLGSRLKR